MRLDALDRVASVPGKTVILKAGMADGVSNESRKQR